MNNSNEINRIFNSPPLKSLDHNLETTNKQGGDSTNFYHSDQSIDKSSSPQFSTLSVGDIDGGNYSGFESDGTIKCNGNASVWTDLRFPTTQTKVGSNALPHFDYTNIGLLFPQNKTDEKVYIVAQMDHSKKLDSPVSLHVHFIQTSTNVPIFNAGIRFYNNGSIVPSYTTISTTLQTPQFSYPGTGSILQIIDFPDISAPTDEDVSANLDIILYRNDNVVSGDVLVKFIDIHYESDTLGSRSEYIK